jgi:hypothetical protein
MPLCKVPSTKSFLPRELVQKVSWLGAQLFQHTEFLTRPDLSPSMDSGRTQRLKDRCRKFRVLIIGRANAGKTTILRTVCDTTEEPEIYNIRGEKVGRDNDRGRYTRTYDANRVLGGPLSHCRICRGESLDSVEQHQLRLSSVENMILITRWYSKPTPVSVSMTLAVSSRVACWNWTK